jgi:hypothetical protein
MKSNYTSHFYSVLLIIIVLHLNLPNSPNGCRYPKSDPTHWTYYPFFPKWSSQMVQKTNRCPLLGSPRTDRALEADVVSLVPPISGPLAYLTPSTPPLCLPPISAHPLSSGSTPSWFLCLFFLRQIQMWGDSDRRHRCNMST